MINLNDVRRLLEQADDHTLSLYLNVNPADQENQASTPIWRIWLKNALKEIENGLDKDKTDLWRHLRARLETHLKLYAPQSKGLALFFGPSLEVEYALPVPVENRIRFGRPLIAPLVWAIDEYEHYLVVLVDQEKAQFLSAYLGSAGLEDTMTLEMDTEDWREKTIMPSTAATVRGYGLTAGSHLDHLQDRINEHIERFHREVVGRIQELVQEHKTQRVIIGGSEEAAHAVQRLLPDKLAQKVVTVMPIPVRYAPHEVLSHVLPAALEYERQQEMALLDQIINLAKSGGRGALGKEAVLSALDQGRVETLVAPWPLNDSELLSQLPLRALKTNTTLELVHGDAAARLKDEGGLAARLYYAV